MPVPTRGSSSCLHRASLDLLPSDWLARPRTCARIQVSIGSSSASSSYPVPSLSASIELGMVMGQRCVRCRGLGVATDGEVDGEEAASPSLISEGQRIARWVPRYPIIAGTPKTGGDRWVVKRICSTRCTFHLSCSCVRALDTWLLEVNVCTLLVQSSLHGSNGTGHISIFPKHTRYLHYSLITPRIDLYVLSCS
jgi:hypothetical protein